jgi:hypothetical protein
MTVLLLAVTWASRTSATFGVFLLVKNIVLSSNELPPEAYGPPAVVLDAEGVTLWLGGKADSRILWSQIALVEIGIVTAAESEYAEAFWRLAGEDVEFIAPVEVIVNANQLNDKLFTLPGFDMEMYRQARETEAQRQSADFVCWRKGNAKQTL